VEAKVQGPSCQGILGAGDLAEVRRPREDEPAGTAIPVDRCLDGEREFGQTLDLVDDEDPIARRPDEGHWICPGRIDDVDVIESHHAMISPCNEHGRESRLPHLSRTLDRDDWGVLQHLPCSFEQLPWTQGEQFRHAGIVAVQMPVPLIRRPCTVDLPLSNC